MKIVTACSALALLVHSALAQRQAVQPPMPAPEAAHVERVLAGLQQATEGLKGWREAAESGAAIDADELARVQQALEAMGAEFKSLHDRSSAQRMEHATPRAAASRGEAPGAALASQAWSISRSWTEDARALGETGPARRERALAAVRAALEGGDPLAVLAGLQTLRSIGDVAFDKASFRPLVLPLAREAEGPTAVAALYSLVATERRPEDLALVHAAWERTPDAMRGDVLNLMQVFGDRRLEGRSEDIALEVLTRIEGNTNVQFNGLWGARVGPRLEERVLALARDPDREVRHAAIYFGLSTFQDKSPAVVEGLIEALADPDHNDWGRALWGLGHGVPPSQQPRVVDALVDLYASRSDPRVREDCVRIVRNYGGPQAEARLAR